MDKNGIPCNPAGQLCMIIYVDSPCRANGGGGNLGISHWVHYVSNGCSFMKLLRGNGVDYRFMHLKCTGDS